MKSEENCAGGKTVILFPGDKLEKVPKTHRALLTASIREAFGDPSVHFRQVAEICPFPPMKAWLGSLLKEGDWKLALHRGDPPEWTSAAFDWNSSKVRGAEITPSKEDPPATLPAVFQSYYLLVDSIRWMPFGGAGGLEGCRDHIPVSTFRVDHLGTNVDPAKTFVFGWSPGGDMLVYAHDGRGGWLCHENGKVHWLGSIADTIEWVFAELLADRCPDFDYSWTSSIC